MAKSRRERRDRSKYRRADRYADDWLNAQSKDRLYTIHGLWADVRKAWLDGLREGSKLSIKGEQ